MANITTSSGGIAFKIWFWAVSINSLGIAVLSIPSIGIAFIPFAIAVGIFSGIFSFPVFICVWALLSSFIKKGYPAKDIFTALIVLGCVMATGAYGLFAVTIATHQYISVWFCIAAVISGVLGIFISYSNIKRSCGQRDKLLLQPAAPSSKDYLLAIPND